MRLLLLVVLFATTAQAEAGISYLGLCHPQFKCSGVLKSFEGKPIVTGWLENTFGESCACGEKLLKQKKRKVIRVHLSNSPCLRNRRCGKHEVFAGETVNSASRKIIRKDPKLIGKYVAVAQRFKARLEQSRGGLACYVSPCLECDLSNRARRVLFRITRDILPGCVLVDSVHKHTCLQGFTCEQHGDKPRFTNACIADLDGIDGKAVDLRDYRKRTISCDMRLYWEPWLNCIREGPFIEPTKRVCRYPLSHYKKIRRRLWSLSSTQS